MSDISNDKIDAFDLVITALKEHEKKLDDLSSRLERLFKSSIVEEKKGAKLPTDKKGIIIHQKWTAFKEKCKYAKIITFKIDNESFQVHAISDEVISRYIEKLPAARLKLEEKGSYFQINKKTMNIESFQSLIDSKLKCGLSLSIQSTKKIVNENEFLFDLSFQFNLDDVKEFLSKELEIAKEEITEGEITY